MKHNLTKEQLDDLKIKTLQHWKEDILDISIGELVENCPITYDSCPVCRVFDRDCKKCILGSKSRADCLPAVIKLVNRTNDIQNELYELRQEAYNQICRKFDGVYVALKNNKP